ncbi:hypothetical protein M422DRAFT_268075 [Sphaerobolus stellatus SS14]|uniref:Uncharacterized protein n=1 Tax=Sphaerobolus stellatus (strain SS14) TaxID=990650 RepID=A0A0C9UZA6_SPHS4|nr:hypothetical protein M422DRAFT_268075 [Sphaerobolus stellatus SS14]
MKLADKTNKETHMQKRRKLSHSLEDAMIEAIHLSVGKFTYMNMMWLRHPEQLTDLSLAADYDPMKCFNSLDGKLQGQLRELQQAVTSKFHEVFTNILFWKEFKIQMQQQHSNSITRIRHTVGASIFDCKPSELDTATARMKFKEDIRFIEEADGTTRYKSLCPILYKDYEGHHEKRKIFFNCSLFQIYTALVRGSIAVTRKTDASGRPTLEDIWGLKSKGITPGAIAACAIYVQNTTVRAMAPVVDQENTDALDEIGVDSGAEDSETSMNGSQKPDRVEMNCKK